MLESRSLNSITLPGSLQINSNVGKTLQSLPVVTEKASGKYIQTRQYRPGISSRWHGYPQLLRAMQSSPQVTFLVAPPLEHA